MSSSSSFGRRSKLPRRSSRQRTTRSIRGRRPRVTRLSVEEGETAIQGTFNKDAATMLTISDMSVLETKVKVDETDVSRIKIGDSTVIQLDAFPDTTFIGRVSEISNSSVKAATTGGTGGSADQASDDAANVP